MSTPGFSSRTIPACSPSGTGSWRRRSTSAASAFGTRDLLREVARLRLAPVGALRALVGHGPFFDRCAGEPPGSPPGTLPPHSSAAGRPMRILIAEDETIIRLDLRDLLVRAGFDVCAEAHDGEQAIELARAEQPDLAIMDVKMPRLDGIEAARRILDER